MKIQTATKVEKEKRYWNWRKTREEIGIFHDFMIWCLIAETIKSEIFLYGGTKSMLISRGKSEVKKAVFWDVRPPGSC
jgi:hypothetical protein